MKITEEVLQWKGSRERRLHEGAREKNIPQKHAF
jgi:hypothetical protein